MILNLHVLFPVVVAVPLDVPQLKDTPRISRLELHQQQHQGQSMVAILDTRTQML